MDAFFIIHIACLPKHPVSVVEREPEASLQLRPLLETPKPNARDGKQKRQSPRHYRPQFVVVVVVVSHPSPRRGSTHGLLQECVIPSNAACHAINARCASGKVK